MKLYTLSPGGLLSVRENLWQKKIGVRLCCSQRKHRGVRRSGRKYSAQTMQLSKSDATQTADIVAYGHVGQSSQPTERQAHEAAPQAPAQDATECCAYRLVATVDTQFGSVHWVEIVDSRAPQTDSSHTGSIPLVMISTALHHPASRISFQLQHKRIDNMKFRSLKHTYIIARSSVTPKPSLSPACLAMDVS